MILLLSPEQQPPGTPTGLYTPSQIATLSGVCLQSARVGLPLGEVRRKRQNNSRTLGAPTQDYEVAVV